MSISAEDFKGTYTVSQGTKGLDHEPLAYGEQIVIDAPQLGPDLKLRLEVTFPTASGPKSYDYVFEDGSLWIGEVSATSDQLFNVISLYKDPAGSGYKSIYGVVTEGDPEQVGVFGAEGTGG